jgi:maleylpyruvate isomerase
MDTELELDLAGMRRAQATLVDRVAGLDDATARAPSRLPAWTVGHVLTHIARNGDSIARRLEGVARGEVVDQYPGGPEGRAAEIEAGAGRPAAALIDDLAATHERIDSAVAAVAARGEEAWSGLSRDTGGRLRPARDLPLRRWNEVEIHHVDLGLGYEPADWPAEFVERILPVMLAGVGPRLPGLEEVDERTIVAWACGRAAPPGLPELRPY